MSHLKDLYPKENKRRRREKKPTQISSPTKLIYNLIIVTQLADLYFMHLLCDGLLQIIQPLSVISTRKK